MQVGELKQVLEEIPDDSNIILAVNGHHNFCDTRTHGAAQLALLKIQGRPVFVFSATDCGFDPGSLNYNDLVVVKRFRRNRPLGYS